MRFNFSFHFGLMYTSFLLMLFACNDNLFAQTADNTIFRDDFNRADFGSSWRVNPSWSILNGSAYNFIDGTGGSLKTSTNFSRNSYIIESTAKGFTTNYYREFRITFGQADVSNDKMYQLRYTGYGGGRLTLSKSETNLYAFQVLDEVAVFPKLSSSTWYKFKIAKYKSGLIQVYIDKGLGYSTTPILEAIDSTYPDLGHFGWQIDTQTSAEDFFVTWITARKPETEKPAIKEKPAEDNLITQVSAKSGQPYTVSKLSPGVKQYIDRDYTITSVPEFLNRASFIQTANADKLSVSDSFLTFFIKTSAIVYVAYDSRSKELPEWLTHWTKTEHHMGTSDEKAGHLNVYSKLFENLGNLYPNPIVLGGNNTSPALGAKTNYLVAAIKPPHPKTLQAEDAKLFGAVAANNHLQYNGTGFVDFKNLKNDYIEWTVRIDVPGTYNLNFRFANASTQDRLLQISDNGTDVGTVDFNVISSSWSTWAFRLGPNVFLTSGVHKIRLSATGTSGPNIDELSISYVSSSAPPVFYNSYVSTQKVTNELHDMSISAYPNPFLQSTKIYYQVKEKTKVSLTVYTLQGQQIQLLENSVRTPGNYQAEFNAAKYSKGIYFYRLQVGNDVKIGKLIKQ